MCSLFLLITLYLGCAGNQHTLNLSYLPSPVYIGDRMTPSATIDSSWVQTVRSISCYSSHEKEGETISGGKHGTFSSGDYEHVKETISSKVDTTLEDHPHRFIGNVHFVAEVDRGISFISLVGADIKDMGLYNNQSFYVTGTICELKEENLPDQE
jgi:hypothetical protein